MLRPEGWERRGRCWRGDNSREGTGEAGKLRDRQLLRPEGRRGGGQSVGLKRYRKGKPKMWFGGQIQVCELTTD